MNLEAIGAAVGLARAAWDSEMNPELAEVLIEALNVTDEEQIRVCTEKLHKMKAVYAPDCASCPSPCGRTADLDLNEIKEDPPATRTAKENLIAALRHVASRPDARSQARLLLECVCTLGDRLEAEEYLTVCQNLLRHFPPASIG